MSVFSQPSDRYAEELDQVAQAAENLGTYLDRGPNALPEAFPTDQAKSLCAALVLIRGASVEGSIVLLDSGRVNCPALRWAIPPEPKPVDGQTEDPDAPPTWRGGELDDLITKLYAAIGTAIEHHAFETGSMETRDRSDGETLDVSGNSDLRSIGPMAGEAADTFDTIARDQAAPLSAHPDASRTITDARAGLRMAEATATMPRARPGVLMRLGGFLAALPKRMELTGYWVASLGRAGKPLVDIIGYVATESMKGALDLVETVGSKLGECGRILEEARINAPGRGGDDSADETRPRIEEGNGLSDHDLVLRMILREETVPDQLCATITELDFDAQKLSSIEDGFHGLSPNIMDGLLQLHRLRSMRFSGKNLFPEDTYSEIIKREIPNEHVIQSLLEVMFDHIDYIPEYEAQRLVNTKRFFFRIENAEHGIRILERARFENFRLENNENPILTRLDIMNPFPFLDALWVSIDNAKHDEADLYIHQTLITNYLTLVISNCKNHIQLLDKNIYKNSLDYDNNSRFKLISEENFLGIHKKESASNKLDGIECLHLMRRHLSKFTYEL